MIGYKHKLLTTPAEVSHLRDEWFFAWWPLAQPVEPIVREGVITAIEVAFREPDASSDRPTPLPIDSYWVCHPGHSPDEASGDMEAGRGAVEVSVSWSAQQVTMLIHTPDSPYEEHILTGQEPIYVVKRNAKSGKIERVRP